MESVAFFACVWLGVGVDLAAASAVLFRPWRLERSGRALRIHAGRFFCALLVVSLGVLVRVLLTSLWTPDLFALLHVLWAWIFVTLPLLGLLILAAGRRRVFREKVYKVSPTVRVLSVGLLLFSGVGFYSHEIEPRRLVVQNAVISLPIGRWKGPELRVGVLSDLQCRSVGSHERRAVAKLMEQTPHLILIPGDLIQGTREEWLLHQEELKALLRRLQAPAGVWMVQGDVDRADQLPAVLAGSAIRLLNNEVVELSYEGRGIAVGGIGLDWAAPAAKSVIERLEKAAGEHKLCILLAHRPDAIFGLSQGSEIDLIVAGHTHGGQVALPFWGPLVTLSDVPRAIAAGGLNEWKGRRIYVSRGVGCERGLAPKIRFLCPPEIGLLTLAEAAVGSP